MALKNLQIDFCGFTCENPFFLAASPVSRYCEMVERAYQAGWGGAVSKSISLDQDLPGKGLSPRFVSIKRDGSGVLQENGGMGIGNMDFRIDKSVKEIMDGYKELKNRYPKKMLIISLKAQFVQEHWQKLARMAAETGADAIELCLSCPDAGSGGSIGQNPEAVQTVIHWVQEVSRLPLVVKTTEHVKDSSVIAMAAQEAGAVAVSAINTVKGMGGFDQESLTPKPAIFGYSTLLGLSGPTMRSVAQYCVYEIARNKENTLDISGVGGVSNAQDVIDYLLLGARTVQVATKIMFGGYDIVQDFQEGLSRFMERHGFERLSDFIGKGLGSVVPSTADLSQEQQFKSHIVDEACINCGRCYVACRDGAYQAIEFSEDRKASVDEDKCVGCGLCRLVCPVPKAIHLS